MKLSIWFHDHRESALFGEITLSRAISCKQLVVAFGIIKLQENGTYKRLFVSLRIRCLSISQLTYERTRIFKVLDRFEDDTYHFDKLTFDFLLMAGFCPSFQFLIIIKSVICKHLFTNDQLLVPSKCPLKTTLSSMDLYHPMRSMIHTVPLNRRL